jgi:hypothetical protein
MERRAYTFMRRVLTTPAGVERLDVGRRHPGKVLAAVAGLAIAARVADAHAALAAQSTAYCQPGRMADGTYVRAGSVAMNTLPLGSRIRLGDATFPNLPVRDRIGAHSQL